VKEFPEDINRTKQDSYYNKIIHKQANNI